MTSPNHEIKKILLPKDDLSISSSVMRKIQKSACKRYSLSGIPRPQNGCDAKATKRLSLTEKLTETIMVIFAAQLKFNDL